MIKNEFKTWFDNEVKQLEDDPEYIANGLMIELAAQVARKLQKEGLKQKDLAERLDKSQGWISRFMNDPTNFSVKKLVEIAVALGMELDIDFKEIKEAPSFKPKTVTGKSIAGLQQNFSFVDAEYSNKLKKAAQNKHHKDNDLAA
jgi:transcriptional regulator with XRE-family HTH domain